MEFDIDLGLGELEDNDNSESSNIKELKEYNIVPNKGNYLGLDISESSTGVCLYKDGVKTTYNYTINVDESSPHYEVLLRRRLKDCLNTIIFGTNFDVIVIEDVFQGVNPFVTRKLYALNSAIDEMILDGWISCKDFVRVQNQSWKSWLYKVDTLGDYKGYSDKKRIEMCLEKLGVTESGEGYQDRLDATGMILGYIMAIKESSKEEVLKKKISINFEDVVLSYCSEDYEVFNEMSSYGIGSYRSVNESRWSKSKIIEYLQEEPNMAFMSSEYVLLGRFADKFGLPIIDGGGVFGFWINPKKVSKYISDK